MPGLKMLKIPGNTFFADCIHGELGMHFHPGKVAQWSVRIQFVMPCTEKLLEDFNDMKRQSQRNDLCTCSNHPKHIRKLAEFDMRIFSWVAFFYFPVFRIGFFTIHGQFLQLLTAPIFHGQVCT